MKREKRTGDSPAAAGEDALGVLLLAEAKFALNSCGSRHYCARIVAGCRRAAAETIRFALTHPKNYPLQRVLIGIRLGWPHFSSLSLPF